MTVEGHGPPRDIAVRLRDGAGPPVVWLGGFRSDMTATKASALDEWAEKTGRRFVRFDYGGHGASGGRFEECTISSWLDDARAVIDAHADEAPVLVGSSMGGWIACLAARERARRGKPTAGLVLIAPALDFTEELLWANLPEARRRTMEADGFLSVPSEYDLVALQGQADTLTPSGCWSACPQRARCSPSSQTATTACPGRAISPGWSRRWRRSPEVSAG